MQKEQIGGFNPERVRSLKAGMETTLGGTIKAIVILDKDYRCDGELKLIANECELFCDHIAIHRRKEIENFLLIPASIDRAAARKVAEQARRTGDDIKYSSDTAEFLNDFACDKKSYVTAQYLVNRRRFERKNSSSCDEAKINEVALQEFEACWKNLDWRLEVIPGKEAMSAINQHLQDQYGVSITPTAIVDAMHVDEIPVDIKKLIHNISQFTSSKVN